MSDLPNSTWLKAPALQSLFDILCTKNEEARVNGGAVRNSLLGEAVSDVDVSTTMLPDQVMKAAREAGFKAIPTGIEHGTITVVVDKVPFEVTTLRADIETNGRHAVVRFGRDWREDARRRDFTINALYVDRKGRIHDPLDGLADVKMRRVRFIGDAGQRIEEDHLRILRFFRFFAWYGHGAPDRESLKACVRHKLSLHSLSAERVWRELKKMLAAPDPGRAVLWMRQAGVLSLILPESEKWGIDALPRLIRAQDELGWGHDPLLRLMAIVPKSPQAMMRLSRRLKLSRAETTRLSDWAKSKGVFAEVSERAFARHLYRGSPQGITDTLKLELARLREAGRDDDKALLAAASLARLLEFSSAWKKPVFPVKGRDLVIKGMEPGKEMGNHLRALEERWIESGFTLKKKDLLK